jgi:prepilin-type N-terminal cleavage/methylation domain-containing protein
LIKNGFTLIEMMLVLVIVSAMIYMGAGYLQQRTLQLKVDREVAEIQQILNAAVAYYITNNYTWPEANFPWLPPYDILMLQGYYGGPSYLPPQWLYPPFDLGNLYYSWGGSSIIGQFFRQNANSFYVVTFINLPPPASYSVATTIAGMLPLAYVASDGGTPYSCTPAQQCYVVASIVAPTISLANSTNVNYAGLYHSGSCVQAPNCAPAPDGTPMNPEIMVVPASVTGVSDMPGGIGNPGCTETSTSSCQVTAYPLNSFTAFATGPSTMAAGPPTCGNPLLTSACTQDYTGTLLPASGQQNYWRVCLGVGTQKGFVQPSGSAQQQNVWGQVSGTVMVITRCAPASEDNGSHFNVWSN